MVESMSGISLGGCAPQLQRRPRRSIRLPKQSETSYPLNFHVNSPCVLKRTAIWFPALSPRDAQTSAEAVHTFMIGYPDYPARAFKIAGGKPLRWEGGSLANHA